MALHSGSRSIFIEAPLVLVSQISRSGGSLLAQLFDSHPQLYAHPWELRIAFSEHWDWPALDPRAEPGEWFEALHDSKWEKIAAQHDPIFRCVKQLALVWTRNSFKYAAGYHLIVVS